MIKVWVEEEYGYADYIWNAPFETENEITEWWNALDKSVINGLVFGDYGVENMSVPERRLKAYKEFFGGTWEKIEELPARETLDAYMHIHEDHDSNFNMLDKENIVD